MSAAFQHMVTLLSFVLALGVSHQLLCVVEMVRAGSRVRWSWVHGLWMANGFLGVLTWWVGVWDFHALQDWPVFSVLLNLVAVVCVFLAIAFVSPRIPESGHVDLWQFHDLHRRQYAGFTFAGALLGAVESLYYGIFQNVPGQNVQVVIIAALALASLFAFFISNPIVQRVMAIAVVAGDIAFLLIGDPVLRSA